MIPSINFHISNPHSFQRIKDTVGIDIKNKNVSENSSKNLPGHFLPKYFLHYSDLFLFEKGDTDFPTQFLRRHSISGLGLLYSYQKWLIIIGIGWLLYMVIKTKRIDLLFTLFLLLIFPIADSLTIDKAPYATRSYLGIIPLHLLIAFGMYGIYQTLIFLSIKQKKLSVILICLFLFISFSSTFILIKRFEVNPLTTSDFWGWQYGARDIVHYFEAHQSQYDQLIMAPEFNAPEIFFKFYAPNGCKKCIVGTPENSYDPRLNQLFAIPPVYFTNNPSTQFKTVEVIYYPNNTVAFYIGEIVK